MTPNEIGRFTIQEQLPSSNWAQAFQAYDPQEDHQVVVKVQKNRSLYTQSDKSKYEDGMRKVKGFQHASVVLLLEYGEESGRPFFVFPQFSGGNLTSRLESGGLDHAQIIQVFTPLADALDKAAEAGLFHQNLQPDNILFDDKGQPHLAELGVLGVIDSLSVTPLPVANTDYASPEQIRHQDLDSRSHVYSLAAIVYQALTGQPVFHAETESVTLFKHTSSRPQPPSELRPVLPQSVDKVLLKGLRKDPGERYASAGEFISALERAFEDILPPDGLDEFVQPTTSSSESEPSAEIKPTTIPSREKSPGSTTRVLIALAAVAVVVVFGVGIYVSMLVNENAAQSNADATASASAFNVIAMEAEALRVSASQWPLLIYDSFDANELEWFEGREEDEYASLLWDVDGSYTWQATAKRDFVWRVWPRSDFVSDFYQSVEVLNAGGNPEAQYGLILRNNEGSYYYLEVSESNLIRFMVSIQGEWDTLLPQTEATGLIPGESNRLTVVAQGNRFIFFANDLYVGEAFDGRIAEGQNGLALGLSNSGEQATIVFDNFELRAPVGTEEEPASP